MSRDRSLKSTGMLKRHRNVLTRAERIEWLKELGGWTEESRPIGLPKVAHRKVSVGKKSKAAPKQEEGEGKPEATEADTKTQT